MIAIGLTIVARDGRCADWTPVAAEPESLIGPAPPRTETNAPPSPEEATAESLGVRSSSAVRRPPRTLDRPQTGFFDQPRWVMMRSLVFPGWGQLHNGSWIKASAVAAGETYFVLHLIDDKKDLDQLSSAVEAAQAAGDELTEAVLIDEYNTRLDKYTQRQWLLGGLVVYAMLDAYIDAHFRHFKVEFEHGDSALPTTGELRLSLRWSY